MKYYKLEPEVAGGTGEMSEIEYEGYKVKEVKFLHYEFDGWFGDELLTTHPCFIVTESLMNDIISSGLEGVEFKDIKVSLSGEFLDWYGEMTLPKFMEIKCKFVYEEHIDNLTSDFYINKRKDFIVSEKALQVLKQHQLDVCEITPID